MSGRSAAALTRAARRRAGAAGRSTCDVREARLDERARRARRARAAASGSSSTRSIAAASAATDLALDEEPGRAVGRPPRGCRRSGSPPPARRSRRPGAGHCGTPSVRVEARAKQSMVARSAGTSARNPVKTTASASSALARELLHPAAADSVADQEQAWRRAASRGSVAKASRSWAWPLEPRNIATEPITGRPRPSSRAVRRRRAGAEREGSRLTPAGIATTRSGGTPASTTSRRMASPLVITRSASQR